MIDRTKIAALIPHAGIMCLLDSVLHWDNQSIRCVATSHRSPDNPLAVDGWLGTACGVEYAAQAMAIHGGLVGAVGERPKLGYLTSIRALSIYRQRLDDIEDDLVIEAQQLAANNTRFAYGFAVLRKGVKLLDGRATVLLDAQKT
ncbi:MAG: hydroxymyristoyl-ACP dehydratase [Rhodospirillales bacterium]|nr:hydroxymyristoyl-ACP dehydratase [Rhodospirillales bacterium]